VEIKYDSMVKTKLIGFCDNDWADCMDDMKENKNVKKRIGSV